MKTDRYIEISKGLYIERDYVDEFKRLKLTSTDAVFSFTKGRNLAKNNLADFRSRLRFTARPANTEHPVRLFMKRYIKPPLSVQLKNWYYRRKNISLGKSEAETAETLRRAGIDTPRTVAFGEKRSGIFERGSFIITAEIPDAEALERKLPECCTKPPDRESLRLKRNFVHRLALFVKKFHATRLRHRDLYLSHIFYDNKGCLHLIDLSRVFRPAVLSERFRLKDLAQLYYSAPGKFFTGTDRLRFFLAYTGRKKLNNKHKILIRRILKRVAGMARHDKKRGRSVPFKK